MRRIFDAIFDIVVIAILVFIGMAVINNVFMRFLVAVVGCGAMFNNFKYVYDVKKREKKADNKLNDKTKK